LRTIAPLAAVEIFVWVALPLSAFFISKVAFAINLGTGTAAGRIITETLRVIVSGAIALVWLFAWKLMVDTYFWRNIGKKKSASAKSS